MVIDNTSIASFITSFIRTIINSVSDLWKFLLSPIFTIDLHDTLFEDLFQWVIGSNFEFGVYEISFLWFFTSTAIIFLIVMKLISLLNPIG